MKTKTQNEVADEAYDILVSLTETNDYEFPYLVPPLIERAKSVLQNLKRLADLEADGGS